MAQLSDVLGGMLYDGGKGGGKGKTLGLKKEGTVDFPIVVQGCTAETFANFLGWFNHLYVNHLSFII